MPYQEACWASATQEQHFQCELSSGNACSHLQVMAGDVQRVFGLRHVKDLVLDILDTQLGVQPTLHPHLVDLAEEYVHICLRQAQVASNHCLMLTQRSDHVGLLDFVVLSGIWRPTILSHCVGLQKCSSIVLVCCCTDAFWHQQAH